METLMWKWALFHVLLFWMLAVDLGVFHRRSRAVGIREAIAWSVIWCTLAMLFNVYIFLTQGSESSLEFLTGYVIEKSLSVDNIFVFSLIFGYFRVSESHQHKVLFWGILGALAMRGGFIFAGVSLVKQFHWVLYLFGVLLVASGIKMMLAKDAPFDPESNWIMRAARRILRVSPQGDGDRFLTKSGKGWAVTPLFLVLMFVELTDLMFAVDSIPAIMAVTVDPFLIYTSNALAMLGMRSLYFALAGLLPRFVYLHHGLSAILVFVGGKMLLSDTVTIPIGYSLAIIASILFAGIFASIVHRRASTDHPPYVEEKRHEDTFQVIETAIVHTSENDALSSKTPFDSTRGLRAQTNLQR